MKRFTLSIRQSIKDQNWLSVLFMSLVMPDICSSIENNGTNKELYINWFDRYLSEKYYHSDNRFRFSAIDCYVCRCKCLHQGFAERFSDSPNGDVDDILPKQKVIFIPPPERNNRLHVNLLHGMLQMQTDVFCEDVCQAVEKWLGDFQDDTEIEKRMRKLIRIDDQSMSLMALFSE